MPSFFSLHRDRQREDSPLPNYSLFYSSLLIPPEGFPSTMPLRRLRHLPFPFAALVRVSRPYFSSLTKSRGTRSLRPGSDGIAPLRRACVCARCMLSGASMDALLDSFPVSDSSSPSAFFLLAGYCNILRLVMFQQWEHFTEMLRGIYKYFINIF